MATLAELKEEAELRGWPEIPRSERPLKGWWSPSPAGGGAPVRAHCQVTGTALEYWTASGPGGVAHSYGNRWDAQVTALDAALTFWAAADAERFEWRRGVVDWIRPDATVSRCSLDDPDLRPLRIELRDWLREKQEERNGDRRKLPRGIRGGLEAALPLPAPSILDVAARRSPISLAAAHVLERLPSAKAMRLIDRAVPFDWRRDRPDSADLSVRGVTIRGSVFRAAGVEASHSVESRSLLLYTRAGDLEVWESGSVEGSALDDFVQIDAFRLKRRQAESVEILDVADLTLRRLSEVLTEALAAREESIATLRRESRRIRQAINGDVPPKWDRREAEEEEAG